MKTKLILLTILAVGAIVACGQSPVPQAPPGQDGNFCANVGQDEARVKEAFGSILNLKDAQGNPRPATTQEVEAAMFDWVEGSTHDYERRKNMSSFTPPPFGNSGLYHTTVAAPTPTPKKKQ